MEEAQREFVVEMKEILQECRKIREEIAKSQADQDRLLGEFDKNILPRIKTMESNYGNR